MSAAANGTPLRPDAFLGVKPPPARAAVLGKASPAAHDFVAEIPREIGDYIAAATTRTVQHPGAHLNSAFSVANPA